MTTKTEITLPLLPQPCGQIGEYADEMGDAFDVGQMQDYARAAVEADRKRRGEPVAWPKVNGVGRDAEHERSLVIYFASEPTDDQLRSVYEFLKDPQPAEPVKVPSDEHLIGTGCYQTVIERHSQPAASVGPVPDIPVGCEMTRNWSVTVCAEGTDILTLSSEYVAGVADLEPWYSTIRGCAQHLLSFVGDAASVAQEPVSIMERWQDGDDRNMVSRVDTTAPVAAQAQHDELKSVLAAARQTGWSFEKRADGITYMVPLVVGDARAAKGQS
ncbi:hypothetical protein [Castellaniella sp. S9]|uniref:hypothetical protein n=1 Tax=Castellaniella sp. S9 TaxID=2993652 RepID=UPI0022B32C5B|nr:hypothetical protein [Castellaniella sp. S9]